MKTKLPYGTTAENNALMLPEGFLTIDTDKKAIRFHDGVTQGGFELVGVQAYVPPLGANWVSRVFSAALPNVNPVPIAYGNGIWVIAAGATNFYTSTDTVTWTQRSIATLTPYTWGNIWFGNGLFIADIGDRYATSTDGINWTKRAYAGGMGSFQQVCYANGKYVLLSNAGPRAFTSTNGTTWTSDFAAVAGFANGLTPTGLTYFNNLWISLWAASAGNQIATSTDGVTWTGRASGLTASQSITSFAVFNGVMYIVNALGEWASSTNGTTWTKLTGRPVASYITATGTHLVAIVNGTGNKMQVSLSTDSVTWTDSVTAFNYVPRAALFGNNKLVFPLSTGAYVSG